MICPNCNTENNTNSKFCIRCGSNLIGQTIPTEQNLNQFNMNQQIIEPQVQTYNQPQMASQPINNSSVSYAPLNYLMYIIAVLLKPFKCVKEEESKLSNPKTALILSSIVAGAMMLIDLLKTMISSVFVKTMDLTTFQYKTTMELSNLKNLDYLSLIGKNLLMYAGIIVAITLVYYLASLVFKKSLNFIKTLSIAATSLLPYVILGMVVSPILGKIWAPLSIVALVIGIVYSVLIFFNLINNEVDLENTDLKIYFHLICLSILGIAGYYLFVNMLTSSITGELDNILNMFG